MTESKFENKEQNYIGLDTPARMFLPFTKSFLHRMNACYTAMFTES